MEHQDRERPLSPEQIEQRRAAARKATGPRTPLGKARVSVNALQHGRNAGKLVAHAATLARSMEEIGEDPEEFSALHQGIVDSFHPSTLAEETLVREIARLHWERQRLERAQEALIARRVQQLEIDRQRKSLEISRKISSQLPLAQGVIGYLWAEESPEKYQKLLDLLDQLKQMATLGMYQGAGSVLKLIYGEMPNARGVMIRHFFETLAAASPQVRPEAQKESEPEDSSESTTKAENAVQESSELTEPPGASALRRELEAEIASISHQYFLYQRQYVDITPTMRAECLVPSIDQRWLMRQLVIIDGGIDRKVRLLMHIRLCGQTRVIEAVETAEK